MCLRDPPGPTRGGAIKFEFVWDTWHDMRETSKPSQLDAIDRLILEQLQSNGKLSNVELAQRVHLSPSACLRRVKQLEDEGVIAQYVALLNPKAIGQHGTSFTIINLENMSNGLLGAFEQAVRDEPQILDCFYVAGSNDYLIRFAYRDAEDLERFHTEVLMRLPGVARSNSMLVLRTVKKTTALPLCAAASS
jgi:Lrp/AsnC family transcriptional regulator, leucine-responsive regulatory protein